ncbi:hypothetical protein J19TS2_43130 [Cohnella xylanilytica]|nr:hypothetical protein J19TS2_43130 [Cohnella xylanilytica]
MSKLQELLGRVLAVPVPEEKREEVLEEIRRAIKYEKQRECMLVGTKRFASKF